MENDRLKGGHEKSAPLRKFVETVEDRFIEDRFINAIISAFCKHETVISWKSSNNLLERSYNKKPNYEYCKKCLKILKYF
ncbi:hypothetical protein [Aneurinibacillus aneurinilyticus]|jgi:hypothetical protein|uniref:Uncharacterized protein n=1 Tax=Aneurinibacillus aneurinilyticus ATCC 12856 TaxID=649747 RepID=U1X8Z4_ANEAE|nr:hypothetical protein [Aneurinibacillus aneurinilyticus]ERI11028.1 hypothetical protein HMPREF0083_00874 [Aneurinibacillus aneurinilyticus ATCC 12856]MCI1694828.1 hypothetical protein [Aneurinibacillus aneurinilyticus]MED0708762.1 hypothetical protein [Aneurinibacillus aneurinilyticus]MED0722745.1 hypothetical protein [Aneurinibacillus aneurinilyticus]MED0735322.1 hypothetical protein [Aneurinibacillus aneurinilyticus]